MQSLLSQPTTVYELLGASAKAYGNRVALTYIEQLSPIAGLHLTYENFFARLNRTARLLLELAGRHKPVISLLVPNVPESHCLLWAAECIGVANPLNPMLNEEALFSLMLKAGTDVICVPEMDVQLLQVATHIAQRLPTKPKCLAIPHNMDELLQGFSPDELEAELRPKPTDRAAYFHTGGTTGLPKLACHSHANHVAAAFAYVKNLQAGPDDVAINGLPIFHVAGALINGLGGLASGLQMILPGRSGFRDPEVIRQHWRLVEYFGVTIAGGIPTSVAAMLDVPIARHDISSLRFMISGGAPVSAALCHNVREITGVELYQGYGMTECAGVTALPNLSRPSVPGSAGCIIEGMHARIAGGADVGELQLKGATVFLGYVGNGLLSTPEEWLSTGDLGYIDENGNLFITGRAKDLIIRSGHNIDPSLIENCLEMHPSVAVCAAVGMPDEYAGELPVAFVQLKEDWSVSAAELQAFAMATIAERPACPKKIIIVDKLPVTVVGKIFKQTLRELAATDVFLERLGMNADHSTVSVIQRNDGALEVNLVGVDAALLESCITIATGLNLQVRCAEQPA